jgi:hypothetical protein
VWVEEATLMGSLIGELEAREAAARARPRGPTDVAFGQPEPSVLAQKRRT